MHATSVHLIVMEGKVSSPAAKATYVWSIERVNPGYKRRFN